MTKKRQFANILLPIAIPQLFSYEVPSGLSGQLILGQRVLVSFGPRKIVSGLVWELHHNPPENPVKEIIGLLDTDAIVNPHQKQLWEWMADYYLCSLGEVMKAALPAGLKLESHTRILVNEDFEAPEGISEVEELAWLYLCKNPGASIQDLGQVLKKKNPLPIIHQLQKRNAIRLEEKLTNNFKPKKSWMFELSIQYRDPAEQHALLDQLKKAPRQKSALESFFGLALQNESDPQWLLAQDDLKKTSSFSPTGYQALVKKGILLKLSVDISRFSQFNGQLEAPKALNNSQADSLNQLRKPENTQRVSLIHGVTSSGKTEIYIHRIADIIKEGKQVLYLLPEIALTVQIINRLRAVFGDQVGVYHSKYSDNERIEIWQQIQHGDQNLKIILGARSALFLPFNRLGLIIIDEEHENSFKQYDPAPRYHARDSAIVLARIHQAQVVMGTATPALESYFNAKTGKYVLLELNERYSEVPMPQILVAHAGEAYRKKKMTGHFTPLLLEAIDEALVNGEQVILFQNRRGFNLYLECDACGHVPKCNDCDVSLTYHKYRNRLVCHYCGLTQAVPSNCPSCQQSAVRTHGLGTEGLEDELSIIFPTARLARLDLDAARSKKGYSSILEDFDAGKTDILIGTQMISKGLDFENVRVVGVINADNLLHFPDFRSFERSFQLMTQVSGRAGRKNEQGYVVIQSFDPSHRVIQQVIHNDYTGLFEHELAERKNFGYPPFTRLIALSFKHKEATMVERCAQAFAKELRARWLNKILGPMAPAIPRIQRLYIRNILIKSAKGKEHQLMRQHIREVIEKFKKDKVFRSVLIQPNVDPY